MDQDAPSLETHNLAEIASQLAALADGLRSGSERTGEAPPSSAPDMLTPDETRRQYIKMARQTYGDRRRRESILGSTDLLGEPAWDILLDLYIAQGTAQEVSVSSACIGSAAPATTGLRWLGVLQEAGLVVRINDDEDHRRVLVTLSPEGASRMDRYFAEAAGMVNNQSLQKRAVSGDAAQSRRQEALCALPASSAGNAHELHND
ncbi:MAG: hypothetical protein ABJ242_10160 [Marinomonas sp.]